MAEQYSVTVDYPEVSRVDMTKELDENEDIRSTAKGFFRMLRDFAQFKSKPPSELRSYHSVLWLNDFPSAHDCWTCLQTEDVDLDDESDQGCWIEIRKRDRPAPPEPPIPLVWIDGEFPFEDDATPPTLREVVLRQFAEKPDRGFEQHTEEREEHSELEADRFSETDTDTEESAHSETEPESREDRFISLHERPEIRDAWQWYLDHEWSEWAEKHQAWRAHHKIYSRLFSIDRAQQREGEEYELLIGIGLLNWRDPKNRRVYRHVLALPAELEFHREDGVFTIGPRAESGEMRCEMDMLTPDQQPREIEQINEEYRPQLTEDPWDRLALSGWLKAIVHSMGGDYDVSLDNPDETSQRPRINFAPALIFRKRSAAGMVERFETVIKQIEDDGEIPPAIQLLCESGKKQVRSEHDDGEPTEPRQLSTEEVLFPLPWNDEQFEIVDKLQRREGLLVKGPPGTGKSHTIANLICHLLATGNRVLVTAQTPRALRVLRDKLPDETKPLCLSLLGNDRQSLDDLQSSVNVIVNRQDHRRESTRRAIQQTTTELEQLIRRSAELDGRLGQIRESETQSVSIAGGAYQGTAQTIAGRITDEQESFSWFEDEVSSDLDCPLIAVSLKEFLAACRALDLPRMEELQLNWPDGDTDLPSPEHFYDLVSREREALERMQASTDLTSHRGHVTLQNALITAVDSLAEAISKLMIGIENVQQRTAKWIPDAVNEILSDDDLPWKQLQQETNSRLQKLRNSRAVQGNWRIDSFAEISEDQLRADALDLREHLQAGGRYGTIAALLNKIVRRTKYLWKKTRIDGRLCESIDTLNMLIESLEARRELEMLWDDWSPYVQRDTRRLHFQVSRLEEHAEDLNEVVAIDVLLRNAKAGVADVDGLAEPIWSNVDELNSLLAASQAVLDTFTYENARTAIEAYIRRLIEFQSKSDAHPIVGELIEALSNRDFESYVHSTENLRALQRDRVALDRRNELARTLGAHVPLLVESIQNSPENDLWPTQLDEINDAWTHARAKTWLACYHEETANATISGQYNATRERIGECRSILAGAKGWEFCLENMTDYHNQMLQAWSIQNKKIGKGTGKYAARKQRLAREYMGKSREAVPAWVMPMYRLYEQLTPEPGMFDVIIVDEASQCSLDTLFLLYLGKKLVVVGDDEQISPTEIVNKQQLWETIEKQLPGHSIAKSFEPGTSLFDLARIWFKEPVSLREHFRCMPEIIQFSNGLCYDNSLIPLTQYSPDRLEPICTRYVAEGFRTGSSTRVENKPEAELLVEQLAACCHDPRYANEDGDLLTFGVVSMIGKAQAKRIENMLLERLPPEEIDKRRLVCGDAYSFQGDERDVMFLSMVDAPHDNHGQARTPRAVTSSTYKQRYNVAASRAKQQMWVFHSYRLDDVPRPDDLKRKLLQYCRNPHGNRSITDELDEFELRRLSANSERTSGSQPKPFDSWFEVDVYLELRDRRFNVRPQFEVAGYRIDLIVEHVDQRLAIECDGDQWHGPEQYENDLARQRQLERAGWTFHRIRGSSFYSDRKTAIEELIAALRRLGIHPAGDNAVQPDRSNEGEYNIPGVIPESCG